MHARYYFPCYGSITNDPFVRAQYGKVGGGHWLENFSDGHFALPGRQYAWSSGGSSVDDLWPWFVFGPSATTTCVYNSKSNNTTLTFDYVRIQWTVQLKVNCTGENASAVAAYALNITGDMYDVSAGNWLVATNRWSHANNQLGSMSISCVGRQSNSFGPTSYSLPSASASTGKVTYTVVAKHYWNYFAQAQVLVSAQATSGSFASATVSSITMRLASAHCPGC